MHLLLFIICLLLQFSTTSFTSLSPTAIMPETRYAADRALYVNPFTGEQKKRDYSYLNKPVIFNKRHQERPAWMRKFLELDKIENPLQHNSQSSNDDDDFTATSAISSPRLNLTRIVSMPRNWITGFHCVMASETS